MSATITDLFNQFHTLTGSPEAAATLVLAQRGVSKMTVEITLLPKISGADHNTVKGVHAAIYYRGV